MAVMLSQTMPEGVSVELLDEVSNEMNVKSDPPAGLVVHVHYIEAGRSRIVDIWESEDDYQRFAQSRLGPAMQKVAEQHGMQIKSAPDSVVAELHDVIRGR
jgi:hypothetical protein